MTVVAVLRAGELGSLLLAVVTARLDEPVAVPHTWLGVPIDEAGRRVTALTAREGCSCAGGARDLVIDAVRRTCSARSLTPTAPTRAPRQSGSSAGRTSTGRGT